MQPIYLLINLCCILVGYGIGRSNIYGNFVKLNSFVNSFKKNQFASILTSIDLLKQSIFKKKTLSCKMEQNKKNQYDIFYTVDNQCYQFKLIKKRGPQLIITSILNSKNENVTDDIKPLCGVNNDFHKQEYTPHQLGYKHLTFYITNPIGEEIMIQFHGNNKITI